MKLWYIPLLVAVILSGCGDDNPKKYIPKKLICHFIAGQDTVFDPAYDIGIYQGEISWTTQEKHDVVLQHRYSPSTSCSETDSSSEIFMYDKKYFGPEKPSETKVTKEIKSKQDQ